MKNPYRALKYLLLGVEKKSNDAKAIKKTTWHETELKHLRQS